MVSKDPADKRRPLKIVKNRGKKKMPSGVKSIKSLFASEKLRSYLKAAVPAFKAVSKVLIVFIYNFGNLILNFSDAVYENQDLRRIFGKTAKVLRRWFYTASKWLKDAVLPLAGRAVALIKRAFTVISKAEDRQRILRKLKIKAFCRLTGYKEDKLVLPLSEEAKGRLLRVAAGRLISFAAPVLGIIAVLAIIVSAKNYKLGVKVTIDGRELGVVSSEKEYKRILDDVQNYISRITKEQYTLEAKPVFATALVNTAGGGDATNIKDYLFEKASDVITNSYGLSVDGEIVAVNSNREGIQDVLNKELASHVDPADTEARAEFVQSVKVISGIMPKKLEMSLLDIQENIHTTKTKEQKYTVKQGDVLGSIAKKFGMPLQKLMDLNPNVSEKNLQIDEELIVSAAAPLISVKVLKKITYDEEIPFNTVTTKTEALYKNQIKTIKEGQKGTARVTAEVTLIDGRETSRAELSRQVVKKPVSKEIYLGTKNLPAKTATGTLRRPVGGIISSRYGVNRGRSSHTGVDFANPTGTPIMAADGGTVVFAGWSGGYGNCLIIDHGNGMKTRYAHCSRLLVGSGQKVAKGEVIAKVGSTGNSTGSHLHFEVIINGNTVNPLSQIKS